MDERKDNKIKSIIVMIMAALVMMSMMSVQTNAKSSASEQKAYNKYIRNLDRKVKVPYVDGYDYDKHIVYDEATKAYYWKPNWKAKKKRIKLSKFKYYKIINLDNDESPELLLSKTSSAMGNGCVLMCKFRNGKVKPLFCANGLRGGIKKARDNRIVFNFGGSCMDYHVYTIVADAELKKDTTYSWFRVKTYGPYHNVCRHETEVIAESEYDKVCAMEKQIKFKKKTPPVISKKGLKFFKGKWVSGGHNHTTKVVFTKKHIIMKIKYSGSYRYKIISVEKKGKHWWIKGKRKGEVIAYKSNGKNHLAGMDKYDGEWYVSGGSSSLVRQ